MASHRAWVPVMAQRIGMKSLTMMVRFAVSRSGCVGCMSLFNLLEKMIGLSMGQKAQSSGIAGLNGL